MGLGPGCLCEVSNVGIVICHFIFSEEGLEVLGGGGLVRVKPELDNLDHILHAELLLLLGVHLKLDNILGELNKKGCVIINKRLDRGSIRSSPRDGLGTPYRLTKE